MIIHHILISFHLIQNFSFKLLLKHSYYLTSLDFMQLHFIEMNLIVGFYLYSLIPMPGWLLSFLIFKYNLVDR